MLIKLIAMATKRTSFKILSLRNSFENYLAQCFLEESEIIFEIYHNQNIWLPECRAYFPSKSVWETSNDIFSVTIEHVLKQNHRNDVWMDLYWSCLQKISHSMSDSFFVWQHIWKEKLQNSFFQKPLVQFENNLEQMFLGGLFSD